jgi:hypothetical protein
MMIRKTVLSGDPEDVRRELGEACRGMTPHEYDASARMLELAKELAERQDVTVSIVTYDSCSMELQVSLSPGMSDDPILLGRDRSGENCQISWGRWESISDESARRDVADLVIAMLGIQNSSVGQKR